MRISDWSSDVCSSDLAVLCDRLRVPVQLRHLAGGPEPVLGEAQLDRLHHRAGDAQMGIAPGAHRGAAAEVFIAEVQAADEGKTAVGDEDLAVIAEIELEAVDRPLGGAEGPHHRAGCL